MRSVGHWLVGLLVLHSAWGCSDTSNGTDAIEASADCDAPVGLRAWVESGPVTSDVTIFGTTSAPAGVTVRSVFVAGVEAARDEFNHFGFSAQLGRDRLVALAGDAGVASLPVVAFTSVGCTALDEEDQPVVVVDLSAQDPQTDAGVGDAGDAAKDAGAEDGGDADASATDGG